MKPGAPFVVMLIEDDPTMRSLLKTLLEIEGYQTILIADLKGEEILNTIQQNPPQAILLDVFLRETNGIDLLQSLRANPATQSIPILMSSGMDMRDQCLRLGANGFLLKPFMPNELIHWLQRQQASAV